MDDALFPRLDGGYDLLRLTCTVVQSSPATQEVPPPRARVGNPLRVSDGADIDARRFQWSKGAEDEGGLHPGQRLLAGGVGERAEAENMLSGALKSLFAVAEAYPELKANQNFLGLQEELTSTENKISFARQFYNDNAMVYNTRIQTFPTMFIAGMFQFAKRDFFEVKAAAEREAPKVSF